jgi:outer membrane protein TolC
MRSAWLFAMTAAFAGVAHAAPLTYDAALALAGSSAPDLQAKAQGVEAARASGTAAGRLPDPKLTFGVDNFPVSGPVAGRFGPDSMTMATVGVIQDMPSGAKRRAARDRAVADIGVAQASQRIEARDVRLGAALAWVDLYFAEKRLAALADVQKALDPLVDPAPAQLASGASRPAETLEAERLMAVLNDRRADLVAAIGKARAELARWTGDPAPEVSGAPPSYDIDPDALRAGLDRLPALAAYEERSRRADADTALARADKRPDWSWEVDYQHRDPMWGDMVSARATVSLPLFGSKRQDPIIDARAHDANRVRFEREAARRALLAQLDADLADHAMHHERLMRARETLLPLADKRADLEIAGYAAGTTSLTQMLQAMLGFAEAKTDALDREAEVARDGVRIALTYGSDAQ